MPLYSYSRIGCFGNCPRQYKFRYIEKPAIVKPEGVEAFMGKIVHETLEQCYRLAQRGKLMSRDELLAYFLRRWQESLPDNLRIVREGMTADDYYSLGVRSLEMYYDRHQPFDQEMTLGLERRVVFALDPEGKYKLQGYIDRVTRDKSGRLRIQDYKTSGTLPTQQDADADNQLALYQIAVQEMWPDNEGVELVWHYVQFDTALVSHRDQEQLEELKRIYIDKIRMIERAVELDNFPTNETSLCDWCEYSELCPAKGGSGVVKDDRQETIMSLPETQIKSLVDEYIACDDDRKRLENRQKEIRATFKQICDIGEDRLFRGSGGQSIKMTLSKIAKLPTKSSDKDAFEKMQELVGEAGLKDKFSLLDVVTLQKAFTVGSLPESLMADLKEYEKIVILDRLRIKKL